jgi:hypothetical protein
LVATAGGSGDSNVKKGQNGRKSLRRLKPTVDCNANKRRRRSPRFGSALVCFRATRFGTSYANLRQPRIYVNDKCKGKNLILHMSKLDNVLGMNNKTTKSFFQFLLL